MKEVLREALLDLQLLILMRELLVSFLEVAEDAIQAMDIMGNFLGRGTERARHGD